MWPKNLESVTLNLKSVTYKSQKSLPKWHHISDVIVDFIKAIAFVHDIKPITFLGLESGSKIH